MDFAGESLVEDPGRTLRRDGAFDVKLQPILGLLAEVAPEAVVRVDAQLRRLPEFWRSEPMASWLDQHSGDRAFGAQRTSIMRDDPLRAG